jgi:3-methylfumaryl-CoA hydratase
MLGTDFTAWIGRQQQTEDVLEPTRSNALRAALGDAIPLADGAPLPPLYHWLYFWDVQPPRALGPDGHQARGGFLPPVDLPRRMWAAGRISFMQPLHLGERVTRVSSILSVTPKSGRSGRLVFVTVRHELAGANGPALIEEQHIVYRELTSPQASAAPPRAAEPAEATWRHDIIPDSVLLFRYSALTMNGHRIHYDRPFATQDESYPGLVVHGPLQATLPAWPPGISHRP